MGWRKQDPVRWLGLGTLVAYLVLYTTPLLSTRQLEAFSEHGSVPLALLVVLVAVLGRLRRVDHFEERTFWWLQWAGLACWLAGVTALSTELLPRSLGEALFIVSYLAFILSADCQPHRDAGWSRRSDEVRYSVAGALLLTLGLLFYFHITPFIFDGSDYAESTYYLFMALDALLVLRFLHLVIVCKLRTWKLTYALLASAGVLWLTTDTLDHLIEFGKLELGFGSIWDVLWLVPFGLLFLASRTPGPRKESSPSNDTSVQVSLPWALIANAVLFPAFHLTLSGLGLLAEEGRPMREFVVLTSLLSFFGLAILQHRALQRDAAKLRSALTVLVMNEQVQQSQKMETVGRLAGGIAHDLNNILTVLRSYSDLLLQRLRSTDRGLLYAEQISNATDRAASLTQQLLTFSRNRVLRPEVLEAGEVVADAAAMLTRIIDERIQLRIVHGSMSCYVSADASLLVQSIVNLAVNARDAMPDGGTLTIECSPITLGEDGVLSGSPLLPGEYVQIAVTDTGRGLNEATRERIFEPFSSVGRGGSGLGLASVHGMAVQSGGQVFVTGTPDGGSTFTIRLPRVERPRVEERVPDAGYEFTDLGAHTVLVAEDDPHVLAAVRHMLAGLGCEVLEATDGVSALEISQRHEGPIDLLLTDVVMPELDGWALAKHVRAIRPDTRVLFMSGYTGDTFDLTTAREMDFLQKPFTKSELVDCLHTVLGTEGKRGRPVDTATTNIPNDVNHGSHPRRCDEFE